MKWQTFELNMPAPAQSEAKCSLCNDTGIMRVDLPPGDFRISGRNLKTHDVAVGDAGETREFPCTCRPTPPAIR